MVKRIFTQEEYTETSPAYVKGGVQYYLLRVDPQPYEDGKVIGTKEIKEEQS